MRSDPKTLQQPLLVNIGPLFFDNLPELISISVAHLHTIKDIEITSFVTSVLRKKFRNALGRFSPKTGHGEWSSFISFFSVCLLLKDLGGYEAVVGAGDVPDKVLKPPMRTRTCCIAVRKLCMSIFMHWAARCSTMFLSSPHEW